MIRHAHARALARAAALAGAALLIAQPAAARDADWWQLEENVKNGETAQYLVDLGAAHEVSPGVIELPMLMHVEKDGATLGWVDAAVRLNCAEGRAQSVRMTEYDAELVAGRSTGLEDWRPVGRVLDRFFCKGERDAFKRRPDFTAPKF